MSKRRISIILICIMMGIMGCGNFKSNSTEEEKVGASACVPDIVFMNTIKFLTHDTENPDSALTFYDREGNHYVSSDQYVCSLSIEQLIKEYSEGKISDKISYHMSCDKDELIENYQKLSKINKDDYKIIYPEVGPDLIANEEKWYGIYYDKDGNIQVLTIHEKDAHGNSFADDDRINEIYEWYIGTFKK